VHVRAVWTRYGRDAYDALREEVAAIKRDDPLEPVTVLVPTQLCGVAVRRILAHGIPGTTGIAGLAVLTTDRLAEQVATPALVGSGKRPAIGSVLAAAWRQALDEDAGVFAPVARHRATVQALVAAHRELREVDRSGLDKIAESGEQISADLIRLHRRVVTMLSDRWYDAAELRDTATRALRDDPGRAAELGSPVLFLPQDLSPVAARLVLSLDAASPITTIAGLAGEEHADDGVRHSLDLLGIPGMSEPLAGSAAERAHILPGMADPANALPAGTGVQLSLDIFDTEDAEAPQLPDDAKAESPPAATRIFHASDADDEVRCVVRQLTEALTETPAHRIAILYGADEPYARLLAEHLGEAGITTNGFGVRPTIQRTLARTMLDLLALPDHGWRRDELLALVASAPVRGPDGRRTPASRWDRISRAAGVVSGTDWETRLQAYSEHELATARQSEQSDAPSSGLIKRCERNAAAADALRAFVADLRARLDDGATLATWPAIAQWAGETFTTLVGDIDDEPWLPEDEVRAAEKVQRVLSGLAGLGAVETTADLTALRLTLELELADDLPRHGTTGRGVLVGPLSSAIGLDADLVFIVGLAEDVVPGRLTESALLPDRARALTNGQLPALHTRVDRMHRHLLAALAAAPRRVATFPRGDLRRSTVRLPSRWLVPSLRTHSGNATLSASAWQTVRGEWLDGSPSFASALAHSPVLATAQEWRMRAAASATATDDVVLRRALATVRARRSPTLTRFDGDVSGHAVPHPAEPHRIVSPTALETWATCPFAYFAGRLLRVEPVELPETLLTISPIESGNLIHETLDRFFAHESAQGAVPAASQQWTAEQRASLTAIAREVAAEFEARGVTGHRMLWHQERRRILNMLQLLLDDDEKLRAATGRRQVRSELVFGMDGADPVEIPLPNGTSIRFRGAADRVDMAEDEIVVVDYKSGSPRKFTDLGEDNPTANGTKLQLPVYAHAARAALGSPDTPVAAEYWFVRPDDRKQIGLPLTEEVLGAHTHALTVIADGIEAGLFPHRPPKDNGWSGYIECSYCDPDGMGTKSHFGRWQRKRDDPRLAAYVTLVEPDEEAA
jgi:RecB family exonuclease